MKLNLGCGFDLREEYVNVDFTDANGADMAYDLEQTPWPWHDESVDEILALNCLEHFARFDPVWHEIHRILKIGGRIIIEVSYKNTWDPFHRSLWNRSSIRSIENGYATKASPKHAFKKVDGPHFRHLPNGLPWWHFKHYLGLELPPLPFTRRVMSFTLERII